MTQSPSYTTTYIPSGGGSLVWLVADKKLANVSEWQAEQWIASGKAKWAQIHVQHKHHIPPWADIAPSTDPNTVDVYIPGGDLTTL